MLQNFYGKKLTIACMTFLRKIKAVISWTFWFELINFSWTFLRQEIPSSYLNNLYRTRESVFHTRNSQEGLLVTLKCEQNTSRRLLG